MNLVNPFHVEHRIFLREKALSAQAEVRMLERPEGDQIQLLAGSIVDGLGTDVAHPPISGDGLVGNFLVDCFFVQACHHRGGTGHDGRIVG